MSALATTPFLRHLKSLYPRKNLPRLANPWYIVASVAFCASNRAEEVPRVFQHALNDLKAESNNIEDHRLLARKVRDALFKAGLTAGFARAINGLSALHEVMPEELRDTRMMRRTRTPMEEHEKIGKALFRRIYGETADSIQDLMNNIYPDLGWFNKSVIYGVNYGFTEILSPLETSYTMIAALTATDNPKQIRWHLDGAQRGGATLEEVQSVRAMSMKVAALSGVRWRNEIPQVRESFVIARGI
ncbi:hypothetical protein C0995_016475 [Termitomyces sp. Mi166|nr:hypothetical protein C0995_016475 [Termitomyces sp. Mi166\